MNKIRSNVLFCLNNLFKIFILLACLFSGTLSKAQEYKWLGTYSSMSGKTTVISSVGAEGESVIFLVRKYGTTTTNSISFGSFTFGVPRSSPSSPSIYYLVKVDSNDQVVNAIPLGDATIKSMDRDSKGNLYFLGRVRNDKSVFLGESIIKSDGAIWIAQIDRLWRMKWLSQIAKNGKWYNFQAKKIYCSENDSIYFLIGGYAENKAFAIGDSSYYIPTNQLSRENSVFGQINGSTGRPTWSKLLHTNRYYRHTNSDSSYADLFVINDITKLGNNLYLTGNYTSKGCFLCPSRSDTLIMNRDSFISPGGFVIKCALNGDYQSRFNYPMNGVPKTGNEKQRIFSDHITHDDEYLYVGGTFNDSLKWADSSLLTSHAFVSGKRVVNDNIFIASITKDLKPRWIYQPKVISTDGRVNYFMSTVSGIFSKNGFLYVGGHSWSSIEINGERHKPNSPILMKIDYKKNVLWATKGVGGGGTFNTISGTNNSIYAGGFFRYSLLLDTFWAKVGENGVDFHPGFMTKISDYSIVRGEVNQGPYCAGDSIKVPFTEYGNFDTSNYFIAQLSDENGEFDNGFVELGRIKTQNSDTIIGVLPHYQVYSSKDYRIRIISTSPVIQSYYIRDSIRFLIYSRDKADPGGEETICLGDSIQLNTFGGTKWTWSPNYNMDDSSLRRPIVWPEKDTTYQIIIADSSGCGEPDTAYKKIKIHAPEIHLTYDDTLCFGSSTIARTLVTNGSGNYSYKWTNSNGDSLGGSDRLHISHIDKLKTGSQKYHIILDNDCNTPDTTDLVFQFLQPLDITLSADTCTSGPTKILTTAHGGKENKYETRWFKNNSLLPSSESSLTVDVEPDSRDTYRVILNDGCSTADTSEINISRMPEIDFIREPPEGCEDLKVDFTIRKQIKTNNTYLVDLGNGRTVNSSDTSFSHVYQAGLFTPGIKVTTEFGCQAYFSTQTIDVWPKPKLNFSWLPKRPDWDNSTIEMQNLSELAVSYSWDLGLFGRSTEENPSITAPDTGSYPVKLFGVTDKGCEDSILNTIYVFPGFRMYIPTVFSPNNDGLNDFFKPVALDVAKLEFSVFNRWGELIHKGNETEAWYGENSMQGSYLYQVRVITNEGNQFEQSGMVHLVR